MNKVTSILGGVTFHFSDLLHDCNFSYLDLIELSEDLELELFILLNGFHGTKGIQTVPYIASQDHKSINKICSIYKPKEHIPIPARSERIIAIILNSQNEHICLAREVVEGLFVANCLIKPDLNNIGVISVINITNRDILVKDLNLDLRPISDNHVLFLSNKQSTINDRRIVTLLQSIDTDHLNREEAFSLMEILTKYNHIFHLPGDVLTHTDTVMHEIPLIDNAKIVHIKLYRLPLSQREEINTDEMKYVSYSC